MEDISYVPQFVWHFLNYEFTINYVTVFVSWVVMGLLVLFGATVTRNLQEIPGRYQNCGEFFIEAFDKLTNETLCKEFARKYFPLILTLFMFVLLCNWIGMIPAHLFVQGYKEPTADVNTPLALGTIVFFVVHYSGIKVKGLKKYIWDYFEPVIEVKGIKIPNLFMFPLNIVGEIAKVVSLAFRLFGNIMGGGVIFIVVFDLIKGWPVINMAIPIGLYGFFGFFVGTVQAFVFSMLALTYIAVAVTEE